MSCDDMRVKFNEMSNNMSQMGCQYEFMMRMAQPGVPCPDDDTIVELVKTHDYMMAGYEQTMSMCDGMDEMTNRMVSTYLTTVQCNNFVCHFSR